ncbi:1-acyl-sn-glycerol-3-phosphate acyltransferase [Capsaspora owczarzaki ATCC 30864]|uniref:1-acyl-sn-glycerol-3-phosphate acyltransferase n=1 Tax=Capsaspora owczarzaki (strain ATCC 30864) TaxID=595528 RepID=A0A0D2WKW1_CAPO3|nr:1-acyl-sn-glycerol-3-phosphate acyltransferase [Capsaspora owczarzaki ATCC 30864]KJE90348.1 1-acyl-sn-glycerol-3-phosphate acyltransferase [Capsaspora owczarzaki ATCC 30864]|eukprot:XP_004364540.1 1-acyl-sn-glycerol-3-phosphate acyltransferase [Capsaspora owczarzaki ATCC 30864]
MPAAATTNRRAAGSTSNGGSGSNASKGLWTRVCESGIPGVFFGLVFLISGLAVNVLQLASLLLWPVSPLLYRRFNHTIIQIHWSEMIWVAEWWAGIKVVLSSSSRKALEASIGVDQGVALCNHRSDVDWLFGLVLAEKYNCLGGAKAYMKGNTKFLPILGWSWWFLEFVFLSRAWDKDQSKLASACKSLDGFPLPFWMVIFAEGTRYTEEKHRASQEFARANNLPVLRHLLVPRTKGFAYTAMGLRDVVTKVYDVTFAFPEGREPNVGSMLQGKSGEVHMNIEIHNIKDLPQDADAIQQWCRDLYSRKDDLLEYHKQNQHFPGESWEIKRHLFPLVTMASWCTLISGLFLRYIYRAVQAGEHWTVASIFAFLLILGYIVKFLVDFSKANKKKKQHAKKED